MKPANFLDSHEKFLIAIATKGGTEICYCVQDLFYENKFFRNHVISNVKLMKFTFSTCITGVSVVKLFNAVSCLCSF